MIESCSDDSGIFDDDIGHPVSVFSLKAHFKDDIRMRMQDKQLNEFDAQDLDQKMNSLTLYKCNFKTDIRRHRKLAQKKQQSHDFIEQPLNDQKQFQTTLKQRLQTTQFTNADQITLTDTVPKINFIRETTDGINQDATLNLRFNLKTQSHCAFDIQKLTDVYTPSPINRFSSKNNQKLNSRSQEHDSNLDLSFNYTMQIASQNSIQCQDNKKEQQYTKSTIKLKHNHQKLKLIKQQQLQSQKSSQLSILQIDQDGFRGRSLSSVSTPKSILKNPSCQNSVLDIVNKIKFQGRPCFSSLNLIDSNPTKIQQAIQSSAKRVKFCLTKQQARRQNIFN